MNKTPTRHGGPGFGWRRHLHEVIFEADTPTGKVFYILLLLSILTSVVVVMLDSVSSINAVHGDSLHALEWFFTILFTIEYFLRLVCVGRPAKYATSFFGVVDLAAIIPTYVSLLIPGGHYLLVLRVLRVLRVFRMLKFVQYVGEASTLLKALRSSLRKITVFIFAVITLVVILGSMMYMIEGQENGFTSIPRSVYWAVVTLTTVGYGDISPRTPLGQMMAAVVMLLGYAIIVIPTGIVTAELIRSPDQPQQITTQSCPECSAGGHDFDAVCCKYCGTRL